MKQGMEIREFMGELKRRDEARGHIMKRKNLLLCEKCKLWHKCMHSTSFKANVHRNHFCKDYEKS